MYIMFYFRLRQSGGGESFYLFVLQIVKIMLLIQGQLFVCFKKEYKFIGIGILGIKFYDIEFIKIYKRRYLNGKFFLFKIKDQILLLLVFFGSKLYSCQLYNFFYNRIWCNKNKIDFELENLSFNLGFFNIN